MVADFFTRNSRIGGSRHELANPACVARSLSGGLIPLSPARRRAGGRQLEKTAARTSRSGRPLYRSPGFEFLEPRIDVATFWFDSAASTLHVIGDSSDVDGVQISQFSYYGITVNGESTNTTPQTIALEMGSGLAAATLRDTRRWRDHRSLTRRDSAG